MFLSVKLQKIGILSSIVHNIKMFRESREIAVRKEQGWKPILDSRDLLGP